MIYDVARLWIEIENPHTGHNSALFLPLYTFCLSCTSNTCHTREALPGPLDAANLGLFARSEGDLPGNVLPIRLQIHVTT